MKSSILLLSILALIFLIGGVYADIDLCNVDGTSCCNNETCTGLFEEGFPSACSDGNLPEFAGCDADCKPIAKCSKNECNISKDCWDKYQNCYYACNNQTCNLILTESEIRLPEYPNCSQGQGIDINEPQDVICAPDKKQCADGSYVERAGFDCEFMACLSGEKVGFFERIFSWFKDIFS